MWKEASCSTVKEFEIKHEFHQGTDVKVHEWLSNVPPSTWFRSHFSTKSQCDILVNNPSESFNSYIMQARDKPIIRWVEWIRKRLMKRFYVKKVSMEKYGGLICPAIQDKLAKIKHDSRNCFASPASKGKFEVEILDTTHVLDMGARSCSCRMWDLTGILSKLAVAAIQMSRENPKKYVLKFYSEGYLP